MAQGNFGKHMFLVLLGVMVALLPCELALRFFYLDQYPTYSYLEKHKRYLINGPESTEGGMFTRSNYYAFESRHHLNAGRGSDGVARHAIPRERDPEEAAARR